MSTHHCPDHLLAAYALGSATVAEAVIVATHLTLCPVCRARAEAFEAAGGALLEDEVGDPILDSELDAVLARLDEPAPPPRPPAIDPAGVLPSPLVDLVGGLDDLPWKWMVPSVRIVDIPVPVEGTLPLRLVRLNRGYRLPVHDHLGEERAVILAGGWEDQRGGFHRGDFCFSDASLEAHDQRCFPDEDCIVLVLNDGPIVARNPVMRLMLRMVPPL